MKKTNTKINKRGFVPICCALVIPVFIVGGLILAGFFGGGNKGTGGGGETDECLDALYPNIVDEAAYGNAINEFIKSKGGGSSPMNGLGADYVAGAKKAGVHPAYIVTISLKESSFGTAGIALNGSHNAFGRKASSSQPDVNGWYYWSSWKASLNSAEDTEADYIKRKYIDEGKTTIDDIVPTYCPVEDNCDTDGYIEQIKGWMQEINELAGAAIVCIADGSDPGTGIPGDGTKLDVPYYNQFRDSSTSCGGGSSWGFGNAGCGITSQAMVESFLRKKKITPRAVYDRQGIMMSVPTLNSKTGASYRNYSVGNATQAEKAMELAEASIKKGYPVIAHVWPPFAARYHILVITGFDSNGDVYINEPNCSRGVPPYKKKGSPAGKDNLADREKFKKSFYIDSKGEYPGGRGSRRIDYVK